MHTTYLRTVGDSVVLTLPSAFLEQLKLQINAKVELLIDNGHLQVKPISRPHYTMEELLADSDYSQPQPPEEREWVDVPAVGAELM